MKRASKYLLFALLFVAFGAEAETVKFRWGDSNTSNKVKYSNAYDYLKSSNGRAYLYLGEAKIEVVDKVTTKLSLDGLTYVCDATAQSMSNSSFGNHTSGDYLESNLISAEGGQKFSLILVSTCKPTSINAGKPIEPGQYYSISVKTGTSEAKEDNQGNKYVKLVLTAQFTNNDCSMPGEFYKYVEPAPDGGYMWGSSVSGNCKVPKYSDGSSVYLSDKTAKTYVYLGKAEYKYGAINISKLTYLTNSLPSDKGLFGNYKATPASADLIQDERVDFKGGQDYTIFIVTPDKNGKMPPDQLEVGYTANYATMLTGTSTSATTSDLARHAQLVSSKATAVADFYSGVKLVDKDVEPTPVKGYIWGDSQYNNCYVPAYDFSSAKRLSGTTARTYLYLGKAEFKNGVVNMGNLTFVTNSVPGSNGLFGNYSASPTASKLILDDRIDPNGGQDFTIFIVTPNRKNQMPPTPELTPGYEAHYISILTGTSTSAVTSDGARHAQFVVDKATTAKDFYPDKSASDVKVPLIDVSGSTIGIY